MLQNNLGIADEGSIVPRSPVWDAAMFQLTWPEALATCAKHHPAAGSVAQYHNRPGIAFATVAHPSSTSRSAPAGRNLRAHVHP
ncbi:hypothetical protein K523DRAFT_359314 [Schizophyllum commune Tattone D]|nr:hypothetical protein K523DRAFT_359314 [Schizophyllum commune Tattone D]